MKGLTCIPKPLEGIDSRTAPRSHGQIMSELGSLYQQEVRLEEKLVLRRNNQMQTRRELRQVQERRAFLDGVLERRAQQHERPRGLIEQHCDGHAPTTADVDQPMPSTEGAGQ